MKRTELDKGFEYLKNKVAKLGVIPGRILVKTNYIVEDIAKDTGMNQNICTLIANLFVSDGYLSIDSVFLKLTEKGYEVLKDEVWPVPNIELENVLPINPKRHTMDNMFYILWDVIGSDDKENPYYVSGKTFFDVIRPYCVGLPPSYSQYMEELRVQNKSQTRVKWCKNLFCDIGTTQVGSFLKKLSSVINSTIEEKLKSEEENKEDFFDIDDISFPDDRQNIKQSQPMANKKLPKIFISHNTKDKPFAKALVRLMTELGVNDENDIFCSSIPGCGVKFGDDFIEAIRKEYENHDLIILFIHSPRLYASPVSLNEMGAGWVLRTAHRSFLTLDCEFDMLRGVIKNTETAFKVGVEGTYHLLDDFKGFIEKNFGLPPKNLQRWNDYKNDFIKTVETIKYDDPKEKG